MRISRSFISSTNSEKDSSKIAQNEDGVDPSSSTASAAAAAAELGRIGRLRIGVQSALNHLVYGKWRNYTGRLGKLSSLVDNSSENATAICWLLGRPYTTEAVAVVGDVQPPAAEGEGEEEEKIAADYDRMTSSDDFLEDFRSRIWLTYREDFPPLKKLPQKPSSTGSHSPQMTTTDCGWGCMLRSAQMLLAQAFLQLRLGRDFRLLDSSASDYRIYTETIRLFEDWPGSPLGLHALLEMARRRAWVPSNGQHWFSASQAILLLRDALLASADGSPQQLAIHVATDNCVVLSELRSAASSNGGSWKVPVLLAIPLRLGTETLNQIYSPHIRLLFTTATFLGMVCGRPKAAAYLVGCLDNLLLSLDPHVVQSYNPLQNEAMESSAGDGEVEYGSAPKKWASFQCLRPSTIPIEELDPSCALGFLIRSEAELQEWTQAMADNGLAQLESRPTKPSAMFSIVEQRPNCWQGNGREKADDENRGRKGSAKSSSADFELL